MAVTTGRSGEHVWLRVHDHGAGMDPAFLTQATDRFTRADTARSTPGTGLGLAVVDAIVTADHGQLRLCSNDTDHPECGHPPGCDHDSGTAVTVLLPVATPNTS